MTDDTPAAGAAPLLSIVTICRNRAADIRTTCDSVAGQSWRGFEWVVVDGASTDGTADILGEYRDRMSWFVSEKDAGIYDAMNKGLRAARGEWVIFMTGGDRFAAEDVLARIFARGTAGYASADVLYGQTLCEEGGEITQLDVVHEPDGGLDRFYFGYANINHQSAFIRRSLFDRFGPYDATYRIAADREKWLVFAENGCRFRGLDFPVAVYNMEGISGKGRSAGVYRAEMLRMRDAHFADDELPELGRLRERWKGYVAVKSFLPLGAGLSLYAYKETRDGNKAKHCLLGIPVVKVKQRYGGARRLFLFGVIPLGTFKKPPPGP